MSLQGPGFPGALGDPWTNPCLLPNLLPSAQKFKFHWSLEANQVIHTQRSGTNNS